MESGAAFVDYFMPLEESVADAQAKVDELQANLDELAKEYEAMIVYELDDPHALHNLVLNNQSATYTIIYKTKTSSRTDRSDNPEHDVAAGGMISAAAGAMGPAPYWVGEIGPEPFFPAQDGRIVSNTQAVQALRERGGGGATIVNVTINTPINMADRAFVERELAPYIRSELERAL